MKINISKYYPTEIYPRKAVDHFLCNVRGSLIKKTPEEIIRQAFVSYLVQVKKIPIDCILVEYSMSKVKKGDKKRADILVYSDDGKSKVILVVECKKGDSVLTDRATDQGKYYNEIVKANTVIITNGSDFITLSKIDGDYKQINKIPSFAELLKTNSLKNNVIENEPWIRHNFKEIHKPKIAEFYKRYGHIGVDTDINFYPFILNLVGLFQSNDSDFSGIEFGNYKVLKDLGVKLDEFGNAAGGGWPGEYRKLLIKDENNSHQILGIGIMGKGKVKNDEKFGTTTACSCLIVSIEDDFGKAHNSLQLSIDRELKFSNGTFNLYHDGRLSNGNKGSLKRSTVKLFMKQNAPYLFDKNDNIILGEFKDSELYTLQIPYCLEFVRNLLSYAILRDELRRLNT